MFRKKNVTQRYTTIAENAEIISHEADNAEVMLNLIEFEFPENAPERYTTIAENAEIISHEATAS